MKRVFTLLLVLCSFNSQATESNLIYQGKVEGMVCAFCVYNVSKKIAQLPEIDASTVNVDLKTKIVNFNSTSKISFKKLAKVFADSGFKLTELKQVNKAVLSLPNYNKNPVIVFELNNLNIEEYQSVFESIGDVAATTLGKLVIIAPKSVEIAILKPMISGKQNIARVQYTIENNKNNIDIKLYLRK